MNLTIKHNQVNNSSGRDDSYHPKTTSESTIEILNPASIKDWILVSAHHCAPNMGSEHAVGWNLVSRLARHHPILLITQNNEYRAVVEAGVAVLRQEGHHIEAFFVRHGATTDGRKNNLRVFYYLTYVTYQRRVLALAKALMKTHRIVAIHHLTIVGFREPGFLWKLDVPFIWGPVGGLVYAPRILFSELSRKMRIFQSIRNLLTWIQFSASPRVRAAYRAASRTGRFIAATPDIGERFQRRFGGGFVWIPETGSTIDQSTSAHLSHPIVGRPLELLWLGGLLDIKPLGILLDAIACVPDHQRRIHLSVVGDGDARSRYEQHAKSLGANATFVGWIDHEEAKRQFNDADLFVLLSIKDLTTNVVFESLGAGVPIVCLDHHGYASIVDESCGRKIPLLAPDLLRQRLAHELIRFLDNPSLLDPLRIGALRRAASFSWDRNASAIGQIYADIKNRTEKIAS
ncbi:glycosyltransferase family 4 protein [Limnohabitans sp. T6-5]|uniref:glycosyltransferase family 4 protein n=1 Tax=Limnohabitans sp. T6-5 TaxID=1100724 RepID=UPI001E31DD32|nr:glycosyltransferase family 4 protein [Limnohabitans sp. T6-5]